MNILDFDFQPPLCAFSISVHTSVLCISFLLLPSGPNIFIHTFLKMSFLKHIPSLPSSESTSSWTMIRLQIQRFSSQQIFMSTFMKGFIHSSPNVPCFFLSPSFYICSFLYLYSRTFLIFQPLTQHIFQDTFKYPLGSNSWLL